MPLTGREAKLAFAKFATNSWGVAASVTKGAYFQSSGGLRLQPALVNDEAFGQSFLGAGDLGDVTAPDITLTGRARYDDHTYILDALAMGSPTAVTLSNSATGQTPSFQHIFNLAPSTDGLGCTVAVDKVTWVDELTSAKVVGFSETVGDNGVMDISYKLLGSKPTNISSVNINSTVAGASYPALSNRVFRSQGTFRLNVQSGGALAASDAVTISEFELEFERPQDAPHVFGQDYIAAPADNGFPTVQFKVTKPRFTTSDGSIYAALRTQGVKFKADLTYLGSYINSTDRYTKKYEFPHVEVLEWNGADVSGAEQVKPDITFVAKLATSSPTGMAFVNPFRLTRIMTTSIVAF